MQFTVPVHWQRSIDVGIKYKKAQKNIRMASYNNKANVMSSLFN